jgi:hypothetical protein
MPYWLSLLAEVLIADERLDEARAVLDAALVAAEQHADRWWLPEVLRLRASLDPDPSALDMLHRATDLAREHSSLTLEARCRADLAGRDVRSSFVAPIRPANDMRTPLS